jgi:hypothetical protein
MKNFRVNYILVLLIILIIINFVYIYIYYENLFRNFKEERNTILPTDPCSFRGRFVNGKKCICGSGFYKNDCSMVRKCFSPLEKNCFPDLMKNEFC